MKPSDSPSRLRELILLWCDDRLDDAGVAELEDLLRADPAAMQLFAELAHVNACLESLGPPPAEPAHQTRRPFFRFALSHAMLALAAAIALLAVPAMLLLRTGPGPSPHEMAEREPTSTPHLVVAMVHHTLGAEWPVDGLVLRPGSPVEPGRIQFTEGLIQLQFFTGVQLVVEGPADFEIVSAEKAVCRTGRFHVAVPSQATGFHLETPQGDLVDFGTEFGLDLAEGVEPALHVFDGEVAFHPRNQGTSARLGVGQAAALSPEGAGTPRRADADLFASYREVNHMQALSNEIKVAEWFRGSRFWRTHPGLLAYFDFEEHDYVSGTVFGETADPYAEPVGGLVIGASFRDGRWPGKTGMGFPRWSDRVRLSLPGSHRQLTLAAWVRVTRFEPRIHSLLMSDDLTGSGPRWFLDGQQGALRLEIPGGRSFTSAPRITRERESTWMHLATTFDLDRREVEHFLDGASIGRESFASSDPLRIGIADIGNWNHPPRGADHHLGGTIDELMVLSLRLAPEQIAGIAEMGRPD